VKNAKFAELRLKSRSMDPASEQPVSIAFGRFCVLPYCGELLAAARRPRRGGRRGSLAVRRGFAVPPPLAPERAAFSRRVVDPGFDGGVNRLDRLIFVDPAPHPLIAQIPHPELDKRYLVSPLGEPSEAR
jgi:hypothetical protein